MADVRYTVEVGGVQGSVTNLRGLDLAIKQLRANLKNAELGTKQFTVAQRQLAAAAKIQQSVLMSTGGAMGRMGNQTAQAGVAVQNMNFVIRDSPFFFKDLQLGVLAVGNNINPLIDSFQRLKIQAAEMTAQTGKTVTSFSLLRKTMAGPMGLSIAMSLVVTAFQAVVFSMGRADKKAKELKGTLEEVAGAMISLINPFKDVKFEAGIKKFEESIKTIKTELESIEGSPLTGLGLPQAQKVAYKELFLLIGIGTKNLNEEQKERVALLKTSLAIMEKEKDTLEAQKAVSELLTDLGHTQIENEDKKTKELKKQTGERLTHLQLIQRHLLIMEKIRFYEDPANRGRTFGDTPPDLGSGMRLREVGQRPRLADAIEDTKDRLKILNAVASQTGTLLAQAFMNGTVAIDRFLASLIATIAQMFILKGLGAAINSTPAGPAASIVPIIPFGMGFLSKRSATNVSGRIEMDKNKFVVQLGRAENRQQSNYGVSSGSLVET